MLSEYMERCIKLSENIWNIAPSLYAVYLYNEIIYTCIHVVLTAVWYIKMVFYANVEYIET